MCNFVQVFLRDIWPSRADIQEVESKYVIPRMFEVGFLAGNCYDRFVVLGATLLKLGLVIMPWQYIGLHSLFLASKLCARLLSERWISWHNRWFWIWPAWCFGWCKQDHGRRNAASLLGHFPSRQKRSWRCSGPRTISVASHLFFMLLSWWPRLGQEQRLHSPIFCADIWVKSEYIKGPKSVYSRQKSVFATHAY